MWKNNFVPVLGCLQQIFLVSELFEILQYIILEHRLSLLSKQLICLSTFVFAVFLMKYRNDPKFLDRLIWANSADPDQTAPRGAV